MNYVHVDSHPYSLKAIYDVEKARDDMQERDTLNSKTFISSIHIVKNLYKHPTLPAILDTSLLSIFKKTIDNTLIRKQIDYRLRGDVASMIIDIYTNAAEYALESINDNDRCNRMDRLMYVGRMFNTLSCVESYVEYNAQGEKSGLERLDRICTVTLNCVKEFVWELNDSKTADRLIDVMLWIGICTLFRMRAIDYMTDNRDSISLEYYVEKVDTHVGNLIQWIDNLKKKQTFIRELTETVYTRRFLLNFLEKRKTSSDPKSLGYIQRLIDITRSVLIDKYNVDSYTKLPSVVRFEDRFDSSEKYTPIGIGGYGTVIRASLKGDKETIRAVKIQRIYTEDAYLDLVRERDFMRTMHKIDPNAFIGVYGMYILNSQLVALELEYMNYGCAYDLIERIRRKMHESMIEYDSDRRAKITVATALYILKSVIPAVRTLHSCGVVHADIKLGNILLTRELGLKIGDMGKSFTVNERVPYNVINTGVNGKPADRAANRRYDCIYPPEYWNGNCKESLTYWSREDPHKRPRNSFDKRAIDVWSVGALFHSVYSYMYGETCFVYSTPHYDMMCEYAWTRKDDPTLHIQYPPSMLESVDSSPKRVQLSDFSTPKAVSKRASTPPPIIAEPVETTPGVQYIKDFAKYWDKFNPAIQECVRLYERNMDKLETLVDAEIVDMYSNVTGNYNSDATHAEKIQQIIIRISNQMGRLMVDERIREKRKAKNEEIERKRLETDKNDAKDANDEKTIASKDAEEPKIDKKKVKFDTIGDLCVDTNAEAMDNVFGPPRFSEGDVHMHKLDPGVSLNEYVVANTTDELSVLMDNMNSFRINI